MSHDIRAGDASLAGQASVIRVKPLIELQAQPVVMRATIHVTRAATGKVETYELTGIAGPQSLADKE